jgi:hypothetical protein
LVASRVADNVGIPFPQTGELGGIEPRIHAGQDGQAPGRPAGEIDVPAGNVKWGKRNDSQVATGFRPGPAPELDPAPE